MPRGRRPRAAAPPSADAIEQEIYRLKQLQAELRQQLRSIKSGSGGVRKLEDRLARHFGAAKWIVEKIRQIEPGYDEWAFYRTVEARQPAPRGRRRQAGGE